MDKAFLKKMFNSAQRPTLDFGLKELSRKAQKVTGQLSISGVQPKLSVKLDRKENQLIDVAEGGEYILKPQTQEFPHIPENEQCCMDIAETLGIAVPRHCLLPLSDGTRAYIVKRFDRHNGEKIHQEDFTQILAARDKYTGSVESIGKKIRDVSSVPGLDAQLFYERVVFNFLIGNGDAHLKNYSLTYPDKTETRLSPAYDIVCSRLAIPDEEVESALTINGRRNKLDRSDFETLGDYFHIPPKIRYEKFENQSQVFFDFIRSSLLDEDSQEEFVAIVKERSQRLGL